MYLSIKNGIAGNDKNPYHRHHNLNDNIIGKFSAKTGLQFIEEKEPPPSERAAGCSFAPIDVLDYIYAVLHSPAYRERYKEFSPIFPASPVRVFINDTQYFDNVPPEAWTFYIGGYQPAQKWLKDRKGKTLNFNDVNHYRRIIRVLKETGELMQQINNISQII